MIINKGNKGHFLIGSLCAVSLICVFCLENNLLTMPHEKKENANNDLKAASETTVENDDNILYKNNLSIEILSCEMIEDIDIENQTTYKAEWFCTGELPDAEYTEKYIDRDAIKEACPELRDLWENDNYTMEETKEIYNRNLDVIEQHTKMLHPKTRYYFVKCRITNLFGKINETSLELDIFISPDDNEYLALATHESAVYFDKAIYTTGEEREKRFFWYAFEEDEVLECVLGYEIKEEWNENEKYYLGVQTPGVDVWTQKNTQLVPLPKEGDLDE